MKVTTSVGECDTFGELCMYAYICVHACMCDCDGALATARNYDTKLICLHVPLQSADLTEFYPSRQ